MQRGEATEAGRPLCYAAACQAPPQGRTLVVAPVGEPNQTAIAYMSHSPTRSKSPAQLLDDPGWPHAEGQPKLLCEPHSITTVYDQSIIGMGIAVPKRLNHYLPCRWKKISHSLAVRIRKPHVTLAIDSNA